MSPTERELLVRLELALARREPSLAGAPLADLIDPAFEEHGTSGRRWSRADIIAMIDGPPNALETVDLDVVLLARDVALITYRSVDPSGRVADAWRSSIWVRRDGRWRIRFHQGTRATAGRAGA
jgi:hypothetical protein